jgi:Cupredoxin-like domain
MLTFDRLRYVVFVVAGMLALTLLLPEARAQQVKEVVVTYRNKHFQPAEVSAPGNTQLTLRIRNTDAEAMEFESETLHVEKIVEGKSEATITLQPLKPGKYGFFDDYHATSEGVLAVK